MPRRCAALLATLAACAGCVETSAGDPIAAERQAHGATPESATGESLAGTAATHERTRETPQPQGPDAASPEDALDLDPMEPTGCDTLAMDPAAHDGVFQIGTRLEAGEEAEVCALFAAPAHDVWMNSSDHAVTPGAHHGVLWLTAMESLPELDQLGEPIELGKVVRCAGNVSRFDPAAKPLSGSQGAGNLFSPRGAFPGDVAIRVPANAYVVMDLHVLNAGSAPIEPCMKVGLNGIPADRVEREAGALLLSNKFITARPGAQSVARMACPITADVQLRTAVSHMHALGVGYEARWLNGDPYAPGTELQRMLYETTQWADPVDAVFDQPLQLGRGDFIDFECRYFNAGDHDVAMGTEAEDEMCLLIGIFWPYDAALANCARREGEVDTAAYQIGDGALTGAEFIDCYWQNVRRPGAVGQGGGGDVTPDEYAARYDFQSCFVEACAPIGRYTRAYVDCVAEHAPECQNSCGGEIAAVSADCATAPAELGGCAEAYGSNGSDGTCAAQHPGDPAATTACTTACLGPCVEHGLDACVVDCLHAGPCAELSSALRDQPCTP